jgi:hypothetical protein
MSLEAFSLRLEIQARHLAFESVSSAQRASALHLDSPSLSSPFHRAAEDFCSSFAEHLVLVDGVPISGEAGAFLPSSMMIWSVSKM